MNFGMSFLFTKWSFSLICPLAINLSFFIIINKLTTWSVLLSFSTLTIASSLCQTIGSRLEWSFEQLGGSRYQFGVLLIKIPLKKLEVLLTAFKYFDVETEWLNLCTICWQALVDAPDMVRSQMNFKRLLVGANFH